MTSKTPYDIHLIAAARPNFMKVAPLYHALMRAPWARPRLVHTGQHYDANMSDAFFRDLGLPEPEFHLNIGSGTHAEQTGGVMIAYEKICLNEGPNWIVVVGDVNSTLACALVGAKLCIPVAHLEAGLRSGDCTMPEEINRIVTDAIADLLWTPSPDADENLLKNGVSADKIERVGNIMIDSFEMLRPQIEQAFKAMGFPGRRGPYGIVTLHRPVNVDGPDSLALLVDQLCSVAARIPLIFPVHPRTRKNLAAFGLLSKLATHPGIELLEPVNYVNFMALTQKSALVITDSGGIQEETTYLGIPCLTVRETTERPITMSQGTNRLVEPVALVDAVASVLRGHWPHGQCPELWDGNTAARVAESLKKRVLA